MLRNGSKVAQESEISPQMLRQYTTGTWAGLGIATLCGGILFASQVTELIGVFPTLFVGTVVAICVAMQLAEIVTPHHPQH